MRLFINSLAASAGGGLTYIRNVLPHLAVTPDLQVSVALTPDLRREFSAATRIDFLELQVPVSRRFWYEQSELPGCIRRSGANVLLSTGNFALRRSPVPQVLLSRNSIYTSADYYRDLRARGDYRGWMQTRMRAFLAKRSIHWASATVAPSEAFAEELRRWTGLPISAIHHGFDHDSFTKDPSPLCFDIEKKLSAAEGSARLLFVSHYNYYRNFETLIRALPFLRRQLDGRSVKLLLTCHLAPGMNPGAYRPESASAMAKELGVSEMIVELGTVPYQHLHHLYARADIYVTPAYAETFAHPLVEAMSCGVPVVASDLAVHREICGDAAVYFPTFSPEGLADGLGRVLSSPEMVRRLAASGVERSNIFSWKAHVKEILALCSKLIC